MSGRISPERAQFFKVNLLVWACLLFVTVYVIIRQSSHLPPRGIIAFPLLGIGYLTVAARTYIGSKRPEGVFTFTPGITLLDIFIVGIGMYATGGKDSGLWLLYFPLLVSEMFTASNRQVVWMLTLVILMNYLAFLPLKFGNDYARLFTQIFFLLAVSGIARSVNDAHVKRERELAALREKFTLADERQRIAREFHDGLGHSLVNAVLGLELAKRMIVKKPESAVPLLEEQANLLRETLDEMRYVVWQMQPANELRGLLSRIKIFAKQLEERAGIMVSCQLPETDPELPPAVEIMLSRVVQEALSNIAKHAKTAKLVDIEFTAANDVVTLSITDDGQGFDPSRTIGGFGQTYMKERMDALGGTFELQSQPGEGTVIVARMPLKESNQIAATV